MKNKLKWMDRRLIAFAYDVVMVIFAWLVAYGVHQNLELIPENTLKHVIALLPVVVAIQTSFFVAFGLYRGLWRFASLPDLVRILKAMLLGVATLIFYNYFFLHNAIIPRSIPLLYAVFLLMFLSAGRFAVRCFKDRGSLFQHHDVTRVLVIGSGNEAESLIREMLRDVSRCYRPVAIIGSDSSTHNREIHGVRVIGMLDKLKSIVENYKVDMIIIAMSDISSAKMNFILEECRATNVRYRIISNLRETIQNGHILSSLRDVNLEDLLGREAYQIDIALFNEVIQGKTVLVTGGGGSIGAELCRQIATLNPQKLCIIDHSEINLYRIELELREQFPQLKLSVTLINILNSEMLDSYFEAHRPQLIFHAAAYKHVPLLESQLLIAVQNNVKGSKNVVDIAVKYGASIFVQVSTDKAVNPTNVMGLTKRVAEIYCQNLNNQTKTKIITVRFGNVLGSDGSVVPLFKEQLQKGGPLTVTHPDIKRYFMTIPEACRLILQTMVMGQGGEIFVLDMGEPIKIKDLAEQMIYLAGKKAGEDIKIVYTGLRPGEKLWEDLFYSKEEIVQTQHKKIFQAAACRFDSEFIESIINQIEYHCLQQNEAMVLEKLLLLVPEYQNPMHNMPDTIAQTAQSQPQWVC